MLILSQAPWSLGDAAALRDCVKAAAAEAGRQSSGPDQHLLLLPYSGEGSAGSDLSLIGEMAKEAGLYIAGATTTSLGDGAPPTVAGFLFGPDGARLIETGKLSPDLIEGFGETRALDAEAATFPVARLPFGQVGMLVGEDILFSHYARALTFRGAELILNPCIERTDPLSEARRMSRYGRATDSCAYVATAGPSSRGSGAAMQRLPTATALYSWRGPVVEAKGDESFILVDLDMELLRRQRATPQGNMPAIVRANVYGEGYRVWADKELAGRAAAGGREEWLAEDQRRIAAEAERCGPKLPRYEEQYDICVIQTTPRLIPLGVDNSREIINANLEENLTLAGSRAAVPSMRLVVFPEFWLTGPGGIGGIQRTVQDMEKLAISHGDEVFDRIGDFARRHKVYVGFQNFEVHEKLPGRVFNSAFLIDDQGKLVHTYRKNQCADVWGFLPDTTPGSIIDEYIDVFGYDGLFPVADTPIGKLANMVCFDNMSPEVAFGLRHAGAEVILHSTSEPHGTNRGPWENARRLRAWENGAYMVSAMDGGEHVAPDSEHLTFFRRGHTKIVNFDGGIQGVVDGPGPVVLRGHIDLASLRRHRANPRTNLAIWSDYRAYADIYLERVGFPSNLWRNHPYENPYLGARELRKVIDDYVKRGIYVEPAQDVGADRYRVSDQV